MQFRNGLFGNDVFSNAKRRGLNMFYTNIMVEPQSNVQYHAIILTDYENITESFRLKLFMETSKHNFYSLLDSGNGVASLLDSSSKVETITLHEDGSVLYNTQISSGVNYAQNLLIFEIRK